MLGRISASLSIKSEPGAAATFAPFASRAGRAVDSTNLIDTLLPGHKIARGRGRRKQLEQMTEAEKKAEKSARMEKMRISARECRLRKKNNIAILEDKLEKYEVKDKRNRNMITRLKDEVQRLQDNLRTLNHDRALAHQKAQQQLHHQHHQQQQRAHQQQRAQQQQEEQAYSHQSAVEEEETMTYTSVHQPAPAATALSWAKPYKGTSALVAKAIKAEPGLYTTHGFQDMTGGRRSSLVVDTAAGSAVSGSSGRGEGNTSSSNGGSRKDATTSDLQLFLQQSGAGNLTPITPRMPLDGLLVPGFQLPNSPANPTFSAFNFGAADQMLLG